MKLLRPVCTPNVKLLLALSRPSVLPFVSVHISAQLALIRISVKFQSGNFMEMCQGNSVFGYNRTKIRVILLEDLSKLYCCINLPLIHSVSLYCWQWHSAQQYMKIVLLRLHCNNGDANAPKYYVINTLPILLVFYPHWSNTIILNCIVSAGVRFAYWVGTKYKGSRNYRLG